jgi:hypothetical protein
MEAALFLISGIIIFKNNSNRRFFQTNLNNDAWKEQCAVGGGKEVEGKELKSS